MVVAGTAPEHLASAPGLAPDTFETFCGQLGSADAGMPHAWVEVWAPGAGWDPFNRTGRVVGSSNLNPVAVARKIQRVAPVTGSFSRKRAKLLSLNITSNVEDDLRGLSGLSWWKGDRGFIWPHPKNLDFENRRKLTTNSPGRAISNAVDRRHLPGFARG